MSRAKRDSGERGLARAIIKSALQDYSRCDDSPEYKSAEKFLFGDGLKYWAMLAGIPPDKVKELLNEE